MSSYISYNNKTYVKEHQELSFKCRQCKYEIKKIFWWKNWWHKQSTCLSICFILICYKSKILSWPIKVLKSTRTQHMDRKGDVECWHYKSINDPTYWWRSDVNSWVYMFRNIPPLGLGHKKMMDRIKHLLHDGHSKSHLFNKTTV